ncbi:hypothetical protein Tco_0126822 [Tanacetum coccineum]
MTPHQFPIHGGSRHDFFGLKASDLSSDHSVGGYYTGGNWYRADGRASLELTLNSYGFDDQKYVAHAISSSTSYTFHKYYTHTYAMNGTKPLAQPKIMTGFNGSVGANVSAGANDFYTAAPLSLCCTFAPEVFDFVKNLVVEFIVKGKDRMSRCGYSLMGLDTSALLSQNSYQSQNARLELVHQ